MKQELQLTGRRPYHSRIASQEPPHVGPLPEQAPAPSLHEKQGCESEVVVI